MKHIVITGASGLVATELTLQLLEDTDYELYLITTRPEILYNRYANEKRAHIYTLETFEQYALHSCARFDVCIHSAFSRSNQGAQIVSSIEFQKRLLQLFSVTGLGLFVNISSQSVYGKSTAPLWSEVTPIDPDYLYAMGKYTSEQVTRLMLSETSILWTNIRLCSVMENARFVRIFVQNALDGKPIRLTAPDQHCSFIDVRDVGGALSQLIRNFDAVDVAEIYNLGANIVSSVEDIANRVKHLGENIYGLKDVLITKEESDNHVRIGMDSTLFQETFSWHPRYDLDDMITSIYELLTGGG